MKYPLFLRLACLTFLVGTSAWDVSAQTVITSLPYTITSSGLYVLNGNLNFSQTSGNLITVNASNVTIDFQGHYIAGPVGNPAQNDTFGIYAYERSNLTVRNGTIAYCYAGMLIDGTGSATTNNVDQQIDNMRVTYCTALGIQVNHAPASRITNCQLSQIGYPGSGSTNGIFVAGAGVTIQGNIICDLVASTANNSVCIYVGAGNFMRQNQVSGAGYGVFGGIYQDNLAHSCSFSFSGGVDGGGNAHD